MNLSKEEHRQLNHFIVENTHVSLPEDLTYYLGYMLLNCDIEQFKESWLLLAERSIPENISNVESVEYNNITVAQALECFRNYSVFEFTKKDTIERSTKLIHKRQARRTKLAEYVRRRSSKNIY